MESRSVQIGNYAATQSLAEVGLGSALHALHVPLTGHFLSLNQIFLLSLAAKNENSRYGAVAVTSGTGLVVSLLKVLSPAGKKLLPMLAIGMQALLYSAGLALVGSHFLGRLLGAVLSSVWAFVQPLLVAYLLLGSAFFEAVEKLWIEMARQLSLDSAYGLWILAGLVATKVFLALLVVCTAEHAGPKLKARYFAWTKKFRLPSRPAGLPASRWRASLRDLMTPCFLLSFLFTLAYFVLSQKKDFSQVVFYALRVLAVAWIFFWLMRSVPRTWVEKLLRKFPVIAEALRQVSEEREPPQESRT